MNDDFMRQCRQLMDGVWTLAAWHLAGGAVHRAPEAVGRFVFLGGTVSMLMRLTTTERENHRYGIGRIAIEDGRLLYGYDQLFDYTRDSRGARRGRKRRGHAALCVHRERLLRQQPLRR